MSSGQNIFEYKEHCKLPPLCTNNRTNTTLSTHTIKTNSRAIEIFKVQLIKRILSYLITF